MQPPVTQRSFRGIWIPAEVWEHPKLSLLDKVVLAEVDSLDCGDGCFASNEYLAKFFGVTDRTVRDSLSALRSLGFIRELSFDGRTRKMRAVLPGRPEENFRADRKETSGQTGRKLPPYILDDNSDSFPSEKSDVCTSLVLESEKQLPLRGCSGRKASKEPSGEGMKYAEGWQRRMASKAADPEASFKERRSFAQAYDALRVLGYSPEKIETASAWVQASQFWAPKVLSPWKLSKTDGNGVRYVDRFLAEASQGAKKSTITAETYAKGF